MSSVGQVVANHVPMVLVKPKLLDARAGRNVRRAVTSHLLSGIANLQKQ